jgi:hypothetical protein
LQNFRKFFFFNIFPWISTIVFPLRIAKLRKFELKKMLVGRRAC